MFMRPPLVSPVGLSIGLLLMVTAAACSSSTLEPEGVCSEVIGYSQTYQWYNAGFEDEVEGGWQGRFKMGGSVDLWIDPDFDGWLAPLVSPCRGDVELVVFNVGSLTQQSHNWFYGKIEAVALIIKQKYPGAPIVFQPNIGGQNCPGVTAAMNHPEMVAAIQAYAATGNASAGVSVVLPCDRYSDSQGHLTPLGAAEAASYLGAYYR